MLLVYMKIISYISRNKVKFYLKLESMKNKKFQVVSGQIIRSPKRGSVRYTPISNDVIQNKNLSFEARGLLIYILSLPQDWVLVKSNIQKQSSIGTCQFNRIWKELTNAGYIYSEKVRNPDTGVFIGWAHIAYEEPNDVNTELGKVRYRITPKSDNHTITKETVNTKQTRIKNKDVFIKPSKEGFNRHYTNTDNTNSVYSIGDNSEGLSSNDSDLKEYVMNEFNNQ